MQAYDKEICKREAELFKALGHPCRLWIVKQLAGGKEYCVQEFVQAINMKFASVSQHLNILKNAGVVIDDKRGKQVFYRLACPCITKTVDCISKKNIK